MMNNLLNGMFGKVGNGMCRLSMNGNIAVKTSSGYKTYNLKTGRLTNCDSFVFNIGEEFFFVIPTNKVSEGDIILVNGKPKCVIEAEKNKITVINYEDSTIDTILPERHVFMGNTYFYGKIVSMFGNDARDGHGTPIVATKVMSSERKDVCQDCARKIQFLIDCILPMVDKDISITFESSEVGKSYRIEYVGDKL